MRNGFTLVELVLVIVVVGLSLGAALPRIGAIRDGWATEQAAMAVILAHRRARVAAVLMSRTLTLTVSADTLRLATASDSTVWQAPGPASTGVVWAGPVRKLTFTPVGITGGLSNATFRFSRGAAIRTVVVSRLGRVRLVRGP